MQAADIVQVLQKAFKASKGISKHRKGSESGSAPHPKQEKQMMTSHFNAMEDEDDIIEHKSLYSAPRRDSKRPVQNSFTVSPEL